MDAMKKAWNFLKEGAAGMDGLDDDGNYRTDPRQHIPPQLTGADERRYGRVKRQPTMTQTMQQQPPSQEFLDDLEKLRLQRNAAREQLGQTNPNRGGDVDPM